MPRAGGASARAWYKDFLERSGPGDPVKTRVGIIFGGKSGEHEVSLQSARSIHEALDKSRYEPVLLGVDKQGVWHLGADASLILNASNPKLIALDGRAPAVVPQEDRSGAPLLLRDRATGQVRGHVDVFFPIIHGTFGEDGSLQGLLRLLDVPYVGAGVLGSAVGMDKDVMKRLLRDAGIPIGDFVILKESDTISYEAIAERLKAPFFVKPANMGSSVGI